jgi:hypothetical protein
MMTIRRKQLDWLWVLWELGLLDDAWPPEEVECD